ncbi:MAG: hypothetical protein DSM107014_14120 [Gomphosphaeria aponina SAG 52.96 = DSM 107014]|uniref:Uncharacterized protein n=1 Tax=Gomphosphaeria aponina SAG 52.96 = DSM 107014 TaxID=1521640 RepID=A0A941GSI5_9CHRO|nr:hypothetical protein [Gomphosphaeria aponina SAG 52.96 = DSM 107014]
MNYQEALEIATNAILELKGDIIDVITVAKPSDIQGAVELTKILSKLSPILGNLIEYAVTKHLNNVYKWPDGCQWIRQDPGFPDAILSGISGIQPGIEVKTWFPLATEITARFRNSETHFQANQTKVVIVCWMLEYIIAGKPKIIDIWIGDALDVARTRDANYHNPPNYIVMEPEDTSKRTRNLQQTNCNGYVFQETEQQLAEAVKIVLSWGENGKEYSTAHSYQMRLHQLTGLFRYRLDTNFAKLDRIGLSSLETFKANVLSSIYAGKTIQLWAKAINSGDTNLLQTLIDS